MGDKQLEVVQIVVALFNAAPGARYLNEFVSFLNNTDSSTKELAGILAQTDVFKQSLYSNTLSNTDFAYQFVNNTVGLLVSNEDKAWAASEIEKMLDTGESRGNVLHWATTALASVDFTNANWGLAAQQFHHKIEVAAFYSIDQGGSATSLSVLQRVIEETTSNIATVTATKTLLASGATGKVIDGYVKEALVFADLNGDRLLNSGEKSSITDAFGNFLIPSIDGFGNLITSGGIDIATGKPFEGIMTAPAGATVITPLTTLVDKIMQDDVSSAQSAVAKALATLGLNTSIDLLHFDSIRETIRQDSNVTATNSALAIHGVSVQIEILVSQTAALLDGAGVVPDETTAIDWAYDALAAMLANSAGRITLTSKSIVAELIKGTAYLSSADDATLLKASSCLTDATQTIANLNRGIIDISQANTSKLKALAGIAAVQVVAETIEAEMKSGAAKGNISSTVISTTGSLFSNAITKAGSKVGDVNGDGKSDAHLLLSSSGGGSPAPSTNIFYLATNATAFSGTAADEVLSISTASAWTPLVMTAVVLDGDTGTNTLSVQDGSNIALATVINFPNLIFDATGVTGVNNVTMSAIQHQNFIETITAPGSGVNGEQVTITGDGNITALADIETYVLEDDSTNVRTVMVTSATTNVTANSASDAVTSDLGALTYTGTITGEGTVDDVISLSNGADISGGTITDVAALTLASGAAVRMTASQNQNFTGTITTPGSGVNGEQVTITGDGNITALADIETYVLEDDSTNARTVTVTSATTNVTANSASDAVLIDLGSLTYTGTTTGEGTVDDVISLSNGADISGSTITDVAALTLASGAAVRMSASQNQNFTGTITAPGSGVNGEQVTITGDGNITTLADIETYVLEDDSTDARILTLDSAALTLIANNTSDIITINAAALEQNTALTLGISTSALTINNLVGDIVASNLTGALTIITADATDNSISLVTGSSATSVDVAAGAASDTVSINAAALANNTILTVTSGTAAAGSVSITDLTGNLTVSDPISGTINLAVTDNTVDDGIAIVAGTSDLAISNVADGDTVTITGFSGSTLTGAIAGATGKFNIATSTATSNIITGAGDDTFTFAAVTGLTSADIVDGGTGMDAVALTGNTAFTATTDFDHVHNIETITLGNTNTAVTITTQDTLVAAGATLTLSTTTTGGLTFNGAAETDGAFNITGGSGIDNITGGSGNDTLTGNNGNDSITAGSGDGTLLGGSGNDTFTFAVVTGLTSADSVDGGTGTDTVALTGNTAFTATTDFDNVQNIEAITLGNTDTAVTITTQDTLVASGATLTLTNAANSGVLTFNGAAETNGTFNITGGSGNDNIIAGSASNTLAGGAGDDIFTFVAGTGLTTDTVNGGTGTDTVALTGITAVTATQFNNVSNIEVITLSDMVSTAIAITTVNALVAAGATLTLTNAANSGVLTFNGAAEADGNFNITGGTGNDIITGGSGSDTLTGGNGNDSMTAGLGNDTLSGDAGNDTFTFAAVTGLTSADIVDGGTGTDTVALTGNTAFTATTDFDNVQNIETITLGNTNTAVTITAQDTLVAAGATLTLSTTTTGGLTFNGAAETDGAFNITGGSGIDNITGGSGNDTLTGNNGNNSITAGLGDDTVSGGTGNDTFTFSAVTGLTSTDIVNGSTGTDTVALTGNTAFTATTDFDNVQNIEAITLGNTDTAVTITTQDTLVASGATLTLTNAANSGALTFNGAAETNGTFNITGGSGNDNIIAGSASNTLAGGAGDDIFTFVAGTGLTTDTVNGGTGTDTVALTGITAVTATQFNNVSNIEVITLSDMVSTAIAITTVNALVAAGATLTLTNAANSGVLTFNGAAEADGNFNITGGTGNDIITGGSGSDTLTGGNGNDSMTAGLGNDTLSGDAGNDTFTFAAVTGLTSADIVDGGTGTDTVALTGNTAFTATTDFDNVQNIETITLGNTNTAVTITAQDTLVAAGATLTLSTANTGGLTFNGAAETDSAFNITSSGASNDTIIGGAGADSIVPGTGTDTISGGGGNDTFTFAAGTGLTILDDVDGGTGTDTVALTGNTAVAATNFDNVSNIETITVANTTGAVAITAKDSLVAAGAVLTLQATSLTTGVLTFNGTAETNGAFIITGSGANDIIAGGFGDDTLSGGNGNDNITAGLGNDTLSGGAGNDTFTFAAASGLTSADNVDGSTGTDTVALTGNTAFTATNDFDNVQNIEAITLGNINTAVTITTQDTLVAAGATLTLTNSANSDVLTFNGAAETNGVFNITGGSGNDNITGGAGNDILAGGTGSDTLVGGTGNETFTFAAVTGLTSADVVDGGTGTDTIALTGNTAFAAANYFDNVQNTEAITVGNTNTVVTITTQDTLVAAGATLTLTTAANSGVLTFNGAAETDGTFNITGGSGNDIITGGSGNDTLSGGNGTNNITAGLGNDTLSGGTGSDTFTFAAVTGLTSADIVNGSTGTDTVALTGNTAFTATNDFDNVQNIEAITLGNTNTAVTITTQDTLVAAGATLTLTNAANSGVLTFTGAAETNAVFNITGGSGNDNITGGAGNDILAGGTGSDTLVGGTGNETFTFAAVTGLTSADVVDGGTGTDTIALTGNTAFAAANYFDIVQNIEAITVGNTNTVVTITTQDTLVAAGATLTLTTAANSGVLTFNGAAETDGTFNITGGSGNDIITGGSGNDTLSGGNGTNNITAGLGNDTLSGGTGSDTFTFAAVTGLTSADIVNGSTGTDTVALTGNTAFTATNDFDNVQNIEAITLGNTNTAVTITTQDTLVAAGATLTLTNAANSGVLTFTGAAETNGVFNITGGSGNDNITGGAGNDILAGGTGSDTLVGGTGNETFTFAAVTGLTSADVVDGGTGTDTIALTGNTAFAAANYFDNVQNIEAITVGNTNTVVTITSQDTLVAAGATLTLTTAANSGVLTFNGSADTDSAFSITGGTGNDSITGGAGNDTLVGGTGNDTLIGEGGNDTITTGAGTDSITGGAGADTITLGSSGNDNTRQTAIYTSVSDGAAAGANNGDDTITQFDANANTATDDLIKITGTFKTSLDDDSDSILDYSVSNGTDLGDQAIIGGANQEATVLLDAELEVVLADFTTSGLANLIAELGEEIDFTAIATGEEHLFIMNFSPTQTAVVNYTAGSGGDDVIVATDIQILGIVTHNDGSGLVANDLTF